MQQTERVPLNGWIVAAALCAALVVIGGATTVFLATPLVMAPGSWTALAQDGKTPFLPWALLLSLLAGGVIVVSALVVTWLWIEGHPQAPLLVAGWFACQPLIRLLDLAIAIPFSNGDGDLSDNVNALAVGAVFAAVWTPYFFRLHARPRDRGHVQDNVTLANTQKRTGYRQPELDRVLRLGVILSIFWLGGIGSAIALRNGLHARRAIKQSLGALKGSGRVWWCILVGGLGLGFWLVILVANLVAVTLRRL